ncbi:hypothetical protein G4Y73_02965 [Wenzhouxiangella sp. XN201]|uniref:pectin acetylesterase-family hydrolase n=1 Tax=Wenzhouxiangella sp. XN201 TaxID=2710755 RepID=UPI0013CD6E5D|nr:pectin acetylesterase-family hydrolase [Wenzhouxiangella sp. XN201]NEZ03109.1 hypothetical protein [Wenzhouxiangella sp. XN201]
MMRCSVLLCVLVVGTVPTLSHAHSLTDEVEAAVRAEVEEQHRQEQKAFIEGDCDKVASFFSDEATRYLGGRRVNLMEGLEFCRNLPRPFGQKSGSPEINDAFHVLAEDAVYFIRTIDFQPSDDDPRSFKREVVTKVWQKTNDEWKIVHFHSSVHSVQVKAQENSSPVNAALPDFSELEDGWNTLHPGGETTCAHGDDFHFFTRVADPDRLMVYLHAGGGCWDARTCDPEQEALRYASTVEPKRDPAGMSGIFDLEHPDNPVAGYSMVAVPVCTGDGRLGDRDVTYTLESESGEARQFTIHHRGVTNTMAAMDWIRSNFESPREIFVAGKSDGALGTPFYASLLAQHYPSARVVGLGDGLGSFGEEIPGADPGQWGVPEVLRRHSGWERFEGDMGMNPVYIHAAHTAPNLRLYQFDHAHDATQRFYLELADAEDLDVLRRLRANRRIIREHVPEFRSFTVGGFRHTVLNQDLFYHYRSNGHRLRDWVAAIVAGESVASVDCGDDCLRPGLVYNEDDLRIVERTIEILSAPDAWNPRDVPGACPTQADRYSLRCAGAQAAKEVTGRTPMGSRNVPPAILDVVFTITERLPARNRRASNPFALFNNHPGTTAADMLAVLEEVRERIRTSLAANR